MTEAKDDLRDRLARLTPEQRRTLARRLPCSGPDETPPALPLSPAQFGIWLFEQLNPGSTAYHNPAALRLRGHLDKRAVHGALRFMAGRHQALRSRVVEDDEAMPVYVPMAGDSVDYTESRAATADEGALLRAVTASARRPFDLERGPLWRSELVRAAPDDHVLVVTFHHVISDGWTLGIFLREFFTVYEDIRGGLPPRLARPRYTHADAVRAVRTASPSRERSLAHWKAALAGAPPAVALPGLRHAGADSRGGSIVFTLDAATTAGLRVAARSRGVSEFSAATAVFLGWLGRHCRQDDVVVTTVVADRRAPQTQEAVGCFLNTLPLRVRLPADGDWDALLRRTGAAVTEALDHADVPFAQIAAAVGESSRGEAAISNVMVLHANAGPDRLEAAGLSMSRLRIPLIASKHQLGLLITPGDDTITCELEYQTGAFSREQAEAAVRGIRVCAAEAARSPAL
ncbi:condensation domain-containing protein [Streptomyces albus]|uniref:condensation domain-containing protein n=1 Tax=Streptomyces albus TaxID=1888 RepID=UPI0033C8CBB0